MDAWLCDLPHTISHSVWGVITALEWAMVRVIGSGRMGGQELDASSVNSRFITL